MASHCEQSGENDKDKVIFLTKEDYMKPISSEIAKVEEEEEEGLITATGEINWDCPCLGGMATGPCGQEFREAFSCFHYSTSEMKGSDCVEKFQLMSDCMSQYPDLYPAAQDDEDDAEGGAKLNDISDSKINQSDDQSNHTKRTSETKS